MAVRDIDLKAKDLETFRALVDTILPAVEGDGPAWTVPGGQLGLENRLDEVFSRIPRPRNRLLLRLFLALLRSAAGGLMLYRRPRAFVFLGDEERALAVRRIRDHPVGLIRYGIQSLKTLIAFLWVTTDDPADRPDAWAAMGYPGPVSGPPATPKPIATLEIVGDTSLSCDVVVVGSGAGGGVAAGVMADAGLDVVVLDAGGYHNESDFSHLESDAYRRMYLDGTLNSTADGGIVVLAGAALGGGTLINYMTSFRTPIAVREEWDRVARFSGVFTGSELDRSFEAVETRLGINSQHGWPSARDQLFEKGLVDRGWHVGEMPRNARGCVQSECGYCTMGCRLGAKQSTLKTYLEDAARAGTRIVPWAHVDQVTVVDDTATGVVASVGPNRLVVAARAVVLAAGALHTPAILLRSGLGGPAAGSYLRLHPVTAIWARFPERVDPWEGTLQSRYSDEFADLDGRGYGFRFETAPVHPLFPAAFIGWDDGASFKRDVLGLGHLDVAGILLRDRGQGRVVLGWDRRPVWRYSVAESDRAHVREGVRRGAELYASAGATEIVSSTGKPVRWTPGEGSVQDFVRRVDAIGYGSNRMNYFTFHQMGSARMGSNPATSVVGSDNETHDTKGLYVMDGSCFPTASGVNPMLSISAVAHRGASMLAEKLA